MTLSSATGPACNRASSDIESMSGFSSESMSAPEHAAVPPDATDATNMQRKARVEKDADVPRVGSIAPECRRCRDSRKCEYLKYDCVTEPATEMCVVHLDHSVDSGSVTYFRSMELRIGWSHD